MDPEVDRFTNPIRGNPTADPTRGAEAATT